MCGHEGGGASVSAARRRRPPPRSLPTQTAWGRENSIPLRQAGSAPPRANEFAATTTQNPPARIGTEPARARRDTRWRADSSVVRRGLGTVGCGEALSRNDPGRALGSLPSPAQFAGRGGRGVRAPASERSLEAPLRCSGFRRLARRPHPSSRSHTSATRKGTCVCTRAPGRPAARASSSSSGAVNARRTESGPVVARHAGACARTSPPAGWRRAAPARERRRSFTIPPIRDTRFDLPERPQQLVALVEVVQRGGAQREVERRRPRTAGPARPPPPRARPHPPPRVAAAKSSVVGCRSVATISIRTPRDRAHARHVQRDVRRAGRHVQHAIRGPRMPRDQTARGGAGPRGSRPASGSPRAGPPGCAPAPPGPGPARPSARRRRRGGARSSARLRGSGSPARTGAAERGSTCTTTRRAPRRRRTSSSTRSAMLVRRLHVQPALDGDGQLGEAGAVRGRASARRTRRAPRPWPPPSAGSRWNPPPPRPPAPAPSRAGCASRCG